MTSFHYQSLKFPEWMAYGRPAEDGKEIWTSRRSLESCTRYPSRITLYVKPVGISEILAVFKGISTY